MRLEERYEQQKKMINLFKNTHNLDKMNKKKEDKVKLDGTKTYNDNDNA